MSEIVIHRGNDELIRVRITDALGAPYDLTGATVACEVKDTNRQSLFTPTVSIVSASDGIVDISMSSEQTATIAPDTVVFDLLITTAAGKKHTVPVRPFSAVVLTPVTD